MTRRGYALSTLTDIDRKRAIAKAIFDDIPVDEIATEIDQNITGVEVTRVSSLELQIKVKTFRAGTRYYSLKLSEKV